MIEIQEQPRRGRPPKEATVGATAPEERRERRRKDGEVQNAGLRLAIPDWVYEKYPETQFRHRWLRDEPGRIMQKYNEDWDPVEGVNPVPGAHDRNGDPVKLILHVKRKEWADQDRARAEERRRDIERQAERGRVTARGDDAGATLAENVAYADDANRLR